MASTFPFGDNCFRFTVKRDESGSINDFAWQHWAIDECSGIGIHPDATYWYRWVDGSRVAWGFSAPEMQVSEEWRDGELQSMSLFIDGVHDKIVQQLREMATARMGVKSESKAQADRAKKRTSNRAKKRTVIYTPEEKTYWVQEVLKEEKKTRCREDAYTAVNGMDGSPGRSSLRRWCPPLK